MRIGVDIDGVLNYRVKFLLECGTKFCVETGKGQLTDLSSPRIAGIFGWDRATRDEFWYQEGYKQLYTWPAQEYAAEVLRRLREEGDEVWIVTGRSEADMKVANVPEGSWEEITRKWLEKNRIEYDGFGFALADKAEFCLQHDIELIVEDLPMYLEGLSGKVRTLIFDCPYNRGIEVVGGERVYSWYDIYSKIKRLEQA